MRKGLPSGAEREAGHRAQQQRWLRGGQEQRGQGARHQDGRSSLQDKGYRGEEPCPCVFRELRAVRRFVEKGAGGLEELLPFHRGLQYRRSVPGPGRDGCGFRQVRQGDLPGMLEADLHPGVRRHRPDEDLGEDRLEALQALSQTQRRLLHAPAAGHREGLEEFPRRGCLGHRKEDDA